ncbi:MAG: serine/threonine-protein kinase [Bryobacteraceae bacterium]|nr:serine/threonine-protein kinase [Bryobacteraceae bacterium]
MTRCPACATEAPDTSRFCPSCGAPLAVAISFATQTVAAPAPTSASRSHNSAPTSGVHGRFIPGTLVSGRYRIVSILGKGGMGEVYRADDLTLGQSVALKFLPESLSANPDASARFRNEVRIARQVSHPNVCRVHDVGEVDGQLFLSMEYVDGEDLASLLRRIGRLPEDKALEIARKLCAGLAAAHEKGVLHRDLKPGNIMLDARGQVLLTDFGLAGLADSIAGNEIRSGTPAYMAPEQLAGKEVTIRSDIYALGLVLYELFTGKRPFEGNSLAELMDAQRANSPATLTSLVRDLDPTIERVITRCLDPEPARRPISALSVSAALPGGDPLAAALAAGETPSPELVAAAGEDVGLRLRVAIPLTAAVLIAICFHAWVGARESMLERLRPTLSPDVLRHTAHNLIRSAGYGDRFDSAEGFLWGRDYANWAQKNDKPKPDWTAIAKGRAPVLRYWYRESPEALAGSIYHDDKLTLGVTTPGDPPAITAGMIYVELDASGRLIEFRSMPAQKLDEPSKAQPIDWTPFFQAAALDRAKLSDAAPLWNFLEVSDTRAAWTGTWPGTNRPLRVEAAAFDGKPVVFTLIGPWAGADRMPGSGNAANLKLILIAVMVLSVLAASVWLARANLRQGRVDHRGAFNLALFMFSALFALWASRMHFVAGFGMLGYFLAELATASAYGLIVWTVYIAAEPFVRRYWPQTLIAWTRILSGRFRDGIVGRDILIGAAVACGWRVMFDSYRLWVPNQMPNMPSEDMLLDARSAIGEILENVPSAIWFTLVMFFAIFLLRMLLRREWIAGLVFTALFLAVGLGDYAWSDLVFTGIVYGSFAVITIRYGLLALASVILVDGTLGDLPASFDSSAWYYWRFITITICVALFVLWAFRQSIRRSADSTP